jgi:hypothetical protein
MLSKRLRKQKKKRKEKNHCNDIVEFIHEDIVDFQLCLKSLRSTLNIWLYPPKDEVISGHPNDPAHTNLTGHTITSRAMVGWRSASVYILLDQSVTFCNQMLFKRYLENLKFPQRSVLPLEFGGSSIP